MRCLPDQVHCSRCRRFYGHLPAGISYSRNQGTPQSAYHSRPQVGMCGTNNPGFPKSWQIIQRRFWLWPCTLSIRTLVDNRDRLGFAPERRCFAPGSNRIAPDSCQHAAWRRGVPLSRTQQTCHMRQISLTLHMRQARYSTERLASFQGSYPPVLSDDFRH